MDDLSSRSNLISRKKLISVLFVVLLLLAIPAAVFLIQKQQIFKSSAATESMTFSGPNVTPPVSGGPATTTNATFQVTVQSPNLAAPTPTP